VISGNGAMADNASSKAPWQQYANNISKIVIGEGVTYIGKFNFSGLKNVTAVEFAENGALKTIGWGAFGHNVSLTEVTIPATVEKLDGYAFYYCANLEKVNFENDSVLTTIGEYAFWNATNLNSINYPNGTVIGEGAFLNTMIK
jgi:hypothetical protein